MSDRRHALPIFLLYFLTSVAFLAFFCKLFYERETRFIIDGARFELKDARREIQMKLNQNGELTADDFAEYNASALNLRTRELIKNDFAVNFDSARDMPPDLFDGKAITVHFVTRGRGGYSVFIRGENLTTKFNELKLKIALAAGGILTAILLIAYFIVRLSLRPLYEKIEFLNAFLRDTTHEIKTPVSVILMSAEMFEQAPQKCLNNIKVAANTIAKLYDDLVELNFKDAGAGKILAPVNEAASRPTSGDKTDVSAMLDERIEYFSAQLSQKNIDLVTDADECEISAPAVKIEKIIDNLLSNAVKYANDGGRIEIFLSADRLCVANSGESIAPENLGKIFELYARFDERNGGLGVGLNLVKKFCDELGFKISCESKNGWTKFCVKF